MKAAAWFLGLMALALVVTLLAMTLGAKAMSVADVWQTLLGQGSRSDTVIVWSVRLPRSLTAFTAGAGLAVSGYLMQVLMRNMLASPDLTGAMSGALVATGLVLLGARDVQASPYRLALAGFATALFLNGLTGY